MQNSDFLPKFRKWIKPIISILFKIDNFTLNSNDAKLSFLPKNLKINKSNNFDFIQKWHFYIKNTKFWFSPKISKIDIFTLILIFSQNFENE